MALPEKLPIRWMPDLHTSHVGRFNVSEQFYLAHHVVHSDDDTSAGREYAALYCFDRAGAFATHRIIGPVDYVSDEIRNTLLESLGPHELTDICVTPFQVKFDGLVFGLVPDLERGTIDLEPGCMITLMAPWNGEYYT